MEFWKERGRELVEISRSGRAEYQCCSAHDSFFSGALSLPLFKLRTWQVRKRKKSQVDAAHQMSDDPTHEWLGIGATGETREELSGERSFLSFLFFLILKKGRNKEKRARESTISMNEIWERELDKAKTGPHSQRVRVRVRERPQEGSEPATYSCFHLSPTFSTSSTCSSVLFSLFSQKLLRQASSLSPSH